MEEKKKVIDNKVMTFVETFHDVIHDIIDLESRTMTFGTDTELSRAEIHLVKTIKENANSSVTKLAEILEVTKGAISQSLAKLSKKEMIKKEIDPENRSRLIIKLTEKGEVAYIGHEKFHNSFDSNFLSLFDDYNEDEMKFLVNFAIKSRNMLQNFNDNIINKDKLK